MGFWSDVDIMMKEGMNKDEAIIHVQESREIHRTSLYSRIQYIVEVEGGLIDIDHLKEKLNNYEYHSPNITEKDIISEVLKYPNYFQYINGLVIDIEEDTFNNIKKYHNYIKTLLRPYFNPSDIQYIVSFLFFLKRAEDINLFNFNNEELYDFIFFKDSKKNLIEQLNKLQYIRNIPFNIIGDFINYIQELDEKVFEEIIYIINRIDINYTSTSVFGKIFEFLIDRNLEHNYTNKSMQKLMTQLSNFRDYTTVLNPFGSLGGLVVETILHNRNNNARYPHIKYNDINKRTSQLAFMTICMYGNSRVEFTSVNSLDTYSDDTKYDLIITELPLAKKFTQSEMFSESVQIMKNNNPIEKLNSRDSILYYLIYVLSKINQNGKAIFNVPSGFLFASNSSYIKVRQFLVETDLIEAIINLPAGTMYHSGINTAIIVINPNKDVEKKNKIKIINGKLLNNAKIKSRELLVESILDNEAILEAYSSETKDSVIVNIDDVSKENYSLDANKFVREVLELQHSLKEGKSRYLKDLVEIKKGKNFDKKYISKQGEFSIVKIQNLYSDIVDIYLKDTDVFDKISDLSSRDIISKDCILIASVGDQIKPTIYKPTKKLPHIFITTNIIAIIPKENISIEYLYYQLYSKIVTEQIKNLTSGSIRTFLTIKSIGELILPYVKLEEQNKYIDIQKSTIIAEQRAELESKLKVMGYKEEIESRESDIVRTLVHQLRATLLTINMEVDTLKNIIKSNDIGKLKNKKLPLSDDGDFEKPHDYTLDEISAKIYDDSTKLQDKLTYVKKVMDFNLDDDDFINNDIYNFFENYIQSKNREIGNKFIINLKGKCTLVDFNRESFIELLDQLVENAEKHAFIVDRDKYKIDFNIRENQTKQIVTIDYYNNGKKFNISPEDYIGAFKKGQTSDGSGIGGNFIDRIVNAHKGKIFIDTQNKEGFKFKIEMPLKHNGELTNE